MPPAFQIAGKDLRLRVRDRSAFIIGIIAPLTLAFIFNAVFGNAASGTGLGLEYGVVDQDGSGISAAFTEVLEGAASEDVLTLDVFADLGVAEQAIEEGEIDAYFVLPAGFEAAVMSNEPTTIQVVGDIDSPTSTNVAASFAEQFSAGVGTSQLAVATAAGVEGVPITPEFVASLGGNPASAAMSFSMNDESSSTKQLDASTYFAAGMAVFFLFFTVQFGVTGLLEEDREGTLTRLMAAPIHRNAVVVGKALLSFLLGFISMVVLVVATSLLMEADWGAPLGVAILIVAGVCSAVGIMGLVAAFARTPEGAGNLGSIIAVVLGMLGGTFFPIATTGGLLAALSFLTPHAWFLLGLADLSNGAPWTAALPAAGAMMVFAVVTSAIAWVLLRRRWST